MLKFLFIFFVTFIAYFQTLWMYFWIDDNALIYKLQHINTYTGFWGKGAFGEGPYRHIIDQFVPFYPLFKTNPTPYFAVGILLYFLAALSVYFFVKLISKNITLAFMSAVIFASGYVGSESIFGITNSWQTSRGIIMALLTLMSFYKFIKTGNSWFYLLSIFLFFFSLDTVYVRAHGLIFSIFFFDLLFWPVYFNRKSIIGFFIRQLPFFVIHYYVYLSDLSYAKRFGILNLLQEIFINGKYYLIFIPLQNIGNLFIPDKLTALIDLSIGKLIRVPSSFSLSAVISGLLFLFFLGFLILKYRKKESLLVKVLFFSSVWMLGNMVIFFLRETSLVLQTTHRYLTYSFVGLSIFWATAFFILAKQKWWPRMLTIQIMTGLVILVYLALGITYQHSFNQQRSLPARKFFSDFQSVVPSIPKGSVIFFDVANNQKIKNEYNGFFGGMFSEAGNLAILGYVEDYTRDFLVTYNFDDLIKLLKEGKVPLKHAYAFYYGSDGLIDNSIRVRTLLQENKDFVIGPENISSGTPFQQDGTYFYTGTTFKKTEAGIFGINPTITINLPRETFSLIPSEFSTSIKVKPKSIELPYSDAKQVNLPSDERENIFKFITERANFQKEASASAASFWNDQEPKLAIDGRLDTSWRGHRGYWDEITRGHIKTPEYLMIDLKKEKTISQIRWTSGFPALTPTNYKILTSLDGQNWKVVKEVVSEGKLPSGTLTTDKFDPQNARFVKMEILNTYGNDGPEIEEIEVIEDKFANLDQESIAEVKNAPFGYIDSPTELNLATSFIEQNATLRIKWMSDAEDSQDPDKYVEIPIKLDGEFHDVKINLRASGQNWVKFSLEGFNFPSDVIIGQTKLIYRNIL